MNLVETLDKILNSLARRQKEVINQRFGLKTTPKTLAQLGEKYGVTRERVRQIEAAALKVLRKSVEEHQQLKKSFELIVNYLENLGGTRRVEFLTEDVRLLLKDPQISLSHLELLFAIFKKPMLFLETKDFHSFWYLSPTSLKDNQEFVKKLLQFLKNKKEDVIEKKQFDYLFYQVIKTHSLKDFAALNFVQNSKKFAVNPFGDFGLTEWREILPKTVRDKSYLVLKKKREPMHFREIAQEINKTKFDIRRAHPQTVHNELIKDPRFVLVGRGLYSLREFGIIPGTTREILKKILKAKGPLPLNKVVEMVSQQRVLKHNTILLNLANRKHFKKSPDGMYRVA
ncbi:hypothetical protein A2108_02580 [Candidatus Wolfebacteria bacterium GWA1_42_9]|uniref:HTH HARE-type domain-containing protein n=1 Tax=Candidatus Wolfebacteria bacterium GWA1_42_9 TaxID=1802553 RepID=A0A1F8DKD4_9BACT|nr:MAG: hypothetical protein A2108_02580 [Candidatus Wolfebacteria bacterium GWA1_42_9]